MHKIVKSDLNFIINKILDIKSHFINKNILLVGGTGFIGKWLVLTFNQLNKKYKSNIKIFILTRDKSKFLNRYSEFKKIKSIIFIQGDILKFKINNINFDYIIHAGSDLKVEKKDQGKYLKELSIGSKRIFEINNKKLKTKVLFLSTGSVYKNNNIKKKIRESKFYLPSEFPINNTYAFGKSLAEIFAKLFIKFKNKNIVIVRGFSFVGPYQQFERGFAITDFIKDSLENNNINLNNGNNIFRSYLYIADLIIWLLHILIKSKKGEIYNVGSDKEINLTKLSKKIIKINKSGSKVIKNNNQNKKINYYVPNIDKAKKKFNLKVWTSLEHSIDKTTTWFKSLSK